MSNTNIFNDFYQVPDLKFDINKLRLDLNKVLKNSKYQTLGITNFHAIPMNKIPGDDSSTQGHNVRGDYWTKPDETGSKNKQYITINLAAFLVTIRESKYNPYAKVTPANILVKKIIKLGTEP